MKILEVTKVESFEEENLILDDFDENLYLTLNDDFRMALGNGGLKSG